ncbi:MAG: hypothetical protein CMN85_04295 [Spongiibacteraceae bacterium]|nr:hypothetical protein [Spongiibacteraceae bacterium]
MGLSASTKAAKGSVWVYGRTVAVQLLNFAAIVVLARELDVADFGIVALASVAISFISTIASQGVNQYIIYDSAEGHGERSKAAFWLNLTISLVALGCGFLLAPQMGEFFGEPELPLLIMALLLRLPFDACTHISDAVLHKQLRFRSIAIRDTILQAAAALLSIYMATSGYGVWSLIVPSLLMAPLQTLVAYVVSGWRPGWNPGLQFWPRIWAFSSHVMGSTFTTFLISEGDTIVVGKLIGSAQLGIYNMAWRTSNLVSRNIVNVANALFLPLLSAASSNRDQLIVILLRILKLISAITFPALIALFVLADDFINVVYGEKWDEAVLPLRVLILYAIRYSVGSPLGPALKALGRPDLIFKLGLATVPVYFIAVWMGSFYGIVGVAVGVTVVRTVVGYVTFKLVADLLRVSISQLMLPLRSSLYAALLMGGVLSASGIALDNFMPGYSVEKLFLMIVIGFIVYMALIRSVFTDIASELSIVSQKILGSRSHIVDRMLNIRH